MSRPPEETKWSLAARVTTCGTQGESVRGIQDFAPANPVRPQPDGSSADGPPRQVQRLVRGCCFHVRTYTAPAVSFPAADQRERRTARRAFRTFVTEPENSPPRTRYLCAMSGSHSSSTRICRCNFQGSAPLARLGGSRNSFGSTSRTDSLMSVDCSQSKTAGSGRSFVVPNQLGQATGLFRNHTSLPLISKKSAPVSFAMSGLCLSSSIVFGRHALKACWAAMLLLLARLNFGRIEA